MIIRGTHENYHNRLYYEWLNNLTVYQQELDHLEQVLDKSVYKGIQLDASIELDALKELIKTEKAEIETLSNEVVKRHQDSVMAGTEQNDGVIAFSELIKTNQLREKIRKAEHSVFYLKYHVNKLLSLAS